MRLLRLQEGKLSWSEFVRDVPKYAILSHTWEIGEEVTFDDITRGDEGSKKGYEKIKFCATQAASRGIQYFWVDTCCINKADIQELQTAINSMYRWYRGAEICFAYMSDVITDDADQINERSTWEEAFRKSRWFSRSWTLQELLAPRVIEFYSNSHILLGNRKSLEQQIHEITGIALPALRGSDLSQFGIEERISWAKDRESTFEEDQAYSLLGICGITMPPNYGEGKKEAFERLREKCMSRFKKDRMAYARDSSIQGFEMRSHEVNSLVPYSGDQSYTAPPTDMEIFHETRIVVQNKEIKRLVDLFNTSLAALGKFEDLATDFVHRSIQPEVNKLRKCRATILQPEGDSQGEDYSRSYPKVSGLLLSIREVCQITSTHSEDYKSENQKSSGGPAQPNWSAKPESKSKRFRQEIDRAAQVELLVKLVQGLYLLVMPSSQEGPHSTHSGSLALSVADHSNNASIPDTDWLVKYREIRARKIKEREADARKQVGPWLLHHYVPNEVYDRFAPERLEGTCDWILEREIFRSWVSESFPANTAKIMWIHGPAGFGKTVLCTRVVSHLLSEMKTPIAHFFFSSDLEREDPYIAIRSWVSQTIAHSQALDLAYDAREAHLGQGATRAQVIEIFQSIVKAIPGCTFVLDGLDECCWEDKTRHKRNSVSEFLDKLIQAVAGTSTRILIVSRDEPEIRQGLFPAGDGLYDCKISIADVQSDTEKYSRSIIERKLARKTNATKQELSMRLAGRCEGQFLWLRMQEDSLDNFMTERQLQKAIDTTPAELEQLYDPNWKKILALPSVQMNRAITILRWVAFAVRPLTVREIVEAQAITDECEDLPIDDIPEAIDEGDIDSSILKICGSLLEVRNNPSEPRFEFKTVHLTHFTVKQYLVSRMPVPGHLVPIHEKAPLDENRHSIVIGKMCLRYVNFTKVWQPSEIEEGQLQRSLRDYASGSWYRHASDQLIDEEMSNLINVFFDAKNPNWVSWRAWVESNDKDLLPIGEDDSESASPLYYASILGFAGTVRYILKSSDHNDEASLATALRASCRKENHEILVTLIQAGASTTDPDDAGNTPLNTASWHGNMKVVEVLLEHGADITVPNKNKVTPILAAAGNGRLDVVKVLIDRGADITVPDECLWTPLHAAVSNGYLEVAKVLLDHGADINIPNKDEWVPLSLAVNNGNLEMVKVLLDHGAELMVSSEDRPAPLLVAAYNGRLEILKVLLDQGADIETSDITGWTPVNLASNSGHHEIVKILLEHGADITVSTNNNTTPILAAAGKGHLEVVQILLDQEADISIINNDGWTPLSSAVSNGHLEVVEVLLDHEADSDVPNKDGWTPVNLASNSGYLEIVKVLVEHGADITISNKKNTTPVLAAAGKGYLDVVEVLLDHGADVNIINNDEWTPLTSAVSNGHVDVVKILLDYGADISVPNKDGWTPVNLASNIGNIEIVKILLEHGADITIPNKNNTTPVLTAAGEGHLDVVKVLLDKGADINIPNKYGWTPINLAADIGHIELVKVLLSQGADITVANRDGWLPVNAAAVNGHVEVVKILLDSGGDITIPNKDGWTPLNGAAENGHLEVVKVLLGHGADFTIPSKDGWTPVNAAADNGHLDVVKILLDQGADITIATKDGWAPLHAAADNGHLEIVELLLDQGADINVEDREHFTPLNAACSNGQVEVIKFLLEKGADITIPNKDGWTPANVAADNGHLEVLKVLIDQGADISLPNNDGWTPVNAAADNGYLEIVKVLLKEGVDISVPHKKGVTPLLAAASGGHPEIVKILLDHGAAIDTQDNDQYTPLNAASSNGHLEVVKTLLDHGADTTIPNKKEAAPIHAAASCGYLYIAKALLDKGADIIAANKGGWTPLNLAADHGHLEVVKILLSQGADITVPNKKGIPPVLAAASNGHSDVVEILLDQGAEIDITDKEKYTPLNAAACNGHLEVVKILVDRGADINICDKDNYTPLNAAACNGHLEIVKLLLDHDADININDKENFTPLNSAACNGFYEVFKVLFERGIDITIPNNNGWTPLHEASYDGNVQIVELLLQNGANASKTNKKGWTALHAASVSGHTEVVKLLLENSPTLINEEDIDGRTALSWAASKDHDDVIQLLLDHDEPGKYLQDHQGRTPLMWAVTKSHEDAAEILLKSSALSAENDERQRLVFLATLSMTRECLEQLELESEWRENDDLLGLRSLFD